MRRKIKQFILDKTYFVWHEPVVLCLNLAKQRGVINNEQWHELAALFDRTQIYYTMKKKVR